MIELKDWLNSINQNKKNLYEEDPDAKYPAYIVNRCMSGHLDTVLFANEMNLNHCLLYTSPSPRDGLLSRMPSSA